MRFFTSDTHFGHANIIKYCDRPFKDFSHMDEVLIANWNNVVGPDDEVWHLGDVAMGSWERWDGIFKRLNGNKFLVIGNHDRIFSGSSERHIERFTPVYDQWFVNSWDHYRGFWLEDGTIVDLSHFPYDGDSHEGDRFADKRLHDGGRILIHGHTHSNEIVTRSKRHSLQIHVGMDAWNYTPVSEEQIINLIEATRNP